MLLEVRDLDGWACALDAISLQNTGQYLVMARDGQIAVATVRNARVHPPITIAAPRPVNIFGAVAHRTMSGAAVSVHRKVAAAFAAQLPLRYELSA